MNTRVVLFRSGGNRKRLRSTKRSRSNIERIEQLKKTDIGAKVLQCRIWTRKYSNNNRPLFNKVLWSMYFRALSIREYLVKSTPYLHLSVQKKTFICQFDYNAPLRGYIHMLLQKHCQRSMENLYISLTNTLSKFCRKNLCFR